MRFSTLQLTGNDTSLPNGLKMHLTHALSVPGPKLCPLYDARGIGPFFPEIALTVSLHRKIPEKDITPQKDLYTLK